MAEISSGVGITVLADGNDPVVADIIFVHGLRGDAIRTWTSDVQQIKQRSRVLDFFGRITPRTSPSPNGRDAASFTSRSVCWPRDLIVEDVPHVRVLGCGYNSDVTHFFAATGQNNIAQHAQNILNDIQLKRRETNTSSRPIVFVCHSLGGIIVKEVLRRSKGATFQPQNQSLYTSTCGVIFLATPHRGSPWATWAKLAANVSKVVLRSPNTAVLDSLNVGNQLLDMIAEEFSIMLRMNDIKAYSFHEERPMSGVLGLNEKVVPDFSAIIGDPSEGREGIDANHIQICKYTGKDDSGYIRVLGAIRLYVDVLNERQSRSEEEQITQDLETLPTAVGQKIRTNRALNHLQLGSTSGHIIIRIPRFPENVLGLSTDYVSPSNRIFGSGAFKLAATLKLLPGQANEGFAQIEDFGLHELVHDNYTYYSRISRRGLLKLLSGKVSRISQEGNSLIVKTGIGLFTFNSVDGQRLVRYDASDRSTDVAMFDVDFEDVQRCVSRRYRRLEPDNPEHEIWMGDHEERRTGSHYWTGPMEPSVAILFQDLDHPSCPRFMSIREPSELERQCQFNGDVLTAFTWVAQQKPALFADLAQSLQLIQILQTKRILQARSLEINNSSSRWMLGEIAASRGLHDNAGESKAFLHRCSLFHDELLEVYGESRSRIAVQNHMLATVEQAKPIVAGASCLAMIAKGNAEFLLTFAVPAPDPWCEMIVGPEMDIWIA